VEKIHMEVLDRKYDEDGNLISKDDDLDDENDDLDNDSLDNDDTYFSSLTPESDVKDLEEEGLSVEDISESDEDE